MLYSPSPLSLFLLTTGTAFALQTMIRPTESLAGGGLAGEWAATRGRGQGGRVTEGGSK